MSVTLRSEHLALNIILLSFWFSLWPTMFSLRSAPGVRQSWATQPGYQHLELVIKGYTPQWLPFMAKTEAPLTLQEKVIERYVEPEDPDD